MLLQKNLNLVLSGGYAVNNVKLFQKVLDKCFCNKCSVIKLIIKNQVEILHKLLRKELIFSILLLWHRETIFIQVIYENYISRNL